MQIFCLFRLREQIFCLHLHCQTNERTDQIDSKAERRDFSRHPFILISRVKVKNLAQSAKTLKHLLT